MTLPFLEESEARGAQVPGAPVEMSSATCSTVGQAWIRSSVVDCSRSPPELTVLGFLVASGPAEVGAGMDLTQRRYAPAVGRRRDHQHPGPRPSEIADDSLSWTLSTSVR